MKHQAWSASQERQEDYPLILPSRTTIGLLSIGSREWVGGEIYICNLFTALHSYRETLPIECRFRIVILAADEELLLSRYPVYHQADAVIRMAGAGVGLLGKLLLLWQARRREINYLYPFNAPLPLWWDVRGAAWIADFQHETLPDLFASKELKAVRSRVAHIAAWSRDIVFSSKAANSDFRRLHPSSKARDHLLHFHTSVDPAVFEGNPEEIQNKYHLPDRFLICSGQFWKHKNHLMLLQAMAIARVEQKSLFVVFTGHPHDPRDRAYLDRFLATLNCLDLRAASALLGLIPRQDQLQLMRRAVAVVQPSLFEGWSTVVEDARSLAKAIVLSDIDVHIEQQHPQAYYFQRFSPESLAEQMLIAWSSHHLGPDRQAEATARRENEVLRLKFARSFINIMHSTAGQR